MLVNLLLCSKLLLIELLVVLDGKEWEQRMMKFTESLSAFPALTECFSLQA